jgi:hypothetical protein
MRKDDLQLYNKLYYEKNKIKILNKIKISKPRKKTFCPFCKTKILISKKENHENTLLHKTKFRIMNEVSQIQEMAQNMFT